MPSNGLGCTFIWRIENFSYKLKGYIESPVFAMSTAIGMTHWHLQLFPEVRIRQDDNCNLGCRLVKDYKSGDTDIIFVDYELSILVSDGSLKKTTPKAVYSFRMGGPHAPLLLNIAYGELFGKMKYLFLPQDTLTLHCHLWYSGEVDLYSGQRFARTRIGVSKRSAIWKIENFSLLELEQDKTFVIESSLKQQLSLRLFLITNSEYATKIQIEISETDTSQMNWTCFKIALIDSEECLDFLTIDDHLFEKQEGIQVWSFPISVFKSWLLAHTSLYLPNDTLSLRCEYVLSVGVVYSELENIELGYAAPHMNHFIPKLHQHRHGKKKDSLKSALVSLYNEKTLCDFELRVGDETIPVHKAVLGARSPVFCRMLSNNMIEKQSNRADIPDLDYDTVKRMLHYMYNDSIEDLQWEYMTKLYTAADKYGIQSLKQKCSSFLLSNLCVSNVCEALELADLHQDNSLKSTAMEYIYSNDKNILLSNDWMQLNKRKGLLTAEVMHWMSMKNIEKESTETAK